ncbi:peptidoglycan editing factor PgeF [Tahibacter harae]|uniref:peptidoglycan editing factor PgeF n=1 Tax=Tahibacter harae TaxID=2963937 RepID=UPI0031BA1793
MPAGRDSSTAVPGVVIPDWELPPGVRAAVSTRWLPGVSPSPFEAGNLGARCGDELENVAANRAVLRRGLDLPSEPVWLRQVHGVDVFDAAAPGVAGRDPHADPVADASYSRDSGIVCAVQTADCLPLLICSGDGTEIAAVHAGWRGLAAGVIEATLARFSAPPAQLRVWLGPAIAAASYEVGEDVRAAFLSAHPHAAAAFTETRPGHWLCDLYELARQRLRAAGVHSVSGGGFDTFTDERFYSHRRARPTGRFVSLIWRESRDIDYAGNGTADRALAARVRASRLTFPRLLGREFSRLPLTVQTLHLAGGTHRYQGEVDIRRNRNPLARLCGFATNLPPAMSAAPLAVEIAAAPEGERWRRDFGGYPMQSRLWRKAGRLCERLGLVTFAFALSVEEGALCWRVQKVSALGLPLPARWFRGVYAREYENAGRYCFEVAAALPLAGELVHYRGWLAVDTSSGAGDALPRVDQRHEPDLEGADSGRRDGDYDTDGGSDGD